MPLFRIFLLLGTLSVACSTSTGRLAGPDTECVPGYSKACSCDGAEGETTCKDDGLGFDLCVSPDDTPDATTDATTDDSGTPDAGPLPECDDNTPCPDDAPLCTPQGVCVLCYPGSFSCQDNKSMECNEAGSELTLAEDCTPGGKQCNAVGVCASPCGGFAKLKGTNAGCDFWAVDLRNGQESLPAVFLDAQNAQFAVIASNTSDTLPAEVTVTGPDGPIKTATLPPQTLTTFEIPPTWGQEGTSRGMSAIRIQSSVPIVAYQFNPLSNENVFSNDASILLPVDVQAAEYYAVTRAHWNTDYPAYLSVVGAAEAGVSVTVTATAPTAGGADIPALGIGESHTFDLAHGEVVTIEGTGGDLTGTRVQVDGGKAMVFSGHTASKTNDKCCADHLEHQLTPVSAWGTDYAIARSVERGGDLDYFRVVAAQDDTTVISGPTNVTLHRGEFHEFKSSTHIEITASKPVMVAQFLASANESCGFGGCLQNECTTDADCNPDYELCSTDFGNLKKVCKPIGDPAMILAVPVAQWQKDFVFLTPASYLLDYVAMVLPKDAAVSLDGEALPAADLETLTGTDYRIYRGPLTDGVHTVTSDKPISVMVHGYDRAVSYGYAGAMKLTP